MRDALYAMLLVRMYNCRTMGTEYHPQSYSSSGAASALTSVARSALRQQCPLALAGALPIGRVPFCALPRLYHSSHYTTFADSRTNCEHASLCGRLSPVRSSALPVGLVQLWSCAHAFGRPRDCSQFRRIADTPTPASGLSALPSATLEEASSLAVETSEAATVWVSYPAFF